MTQMLNPEDKAQILALMQQIDKIYKEAKQRPSGMFCDICGKGDHQAKHAVLKVRGVVHGYERRPQLSPKLCFNHANGWAHSFNSFNSVNQRTAEEIDLHFTLYVANQLKKEKPQ